MKLALASLECRNNDIDFNLRQIQWALQEAAGQGAELVCFGESFLQGFDAFSWNYELDKARAVTRNSPVMAEVCALSVGAGVDLAFGYLERQEESLYSSYMLISKGECLHNYRRISRSWKLWGRTDARYKEGSAARPFRYKDKQCLVALCGDLWEMPEHFRQEHDLLIWPVYVDFSLEDWEHFAPDYLRKAMEISPECVMINSILSPHGMGGCFHFRGGEQVSALLPGQSGLLFVDL